MSDNTEQPTEPQVPSPPLHAEEDKAVHEASNDADTDKDKDTESSAFKVAAAKLNGDQSGALKVHNDGRKGKGLKPLAWDTKLAQHAQAWANHLAKIDKMEHSSGDQRPGEGENLAWAWTSNGVKDPLTGGAKMWMNEAKDYHGEPIGQGNFSKYGHYTQCMWKSTTKVGMASAKSAKGGVYTVGRYSPPGNWTGQKPY